MNKSSNYDVKRNAEIETVIEILLKVLNGNHVPDQEYKKKVITQSYHHDEDIVDLEINDWLTVDSFGNTQAIEEVIPVDFEDY